MLALRQPFAADSERFRVTGPDPVIPTVLGVISFGARGSNGVRHHGRSVRGHHADAAGGAGVLHHALPRAAVAAA
jgi:hypothetical protein